MERQKPHQKTRACSTCPLLNTPNHTGCFDPAVLERTVVDNLAKGFAHTCHNNHDDLCAGYLSYVKHKHPGGLDSLSVVSIGVRLGVIDPDRILPLHTFDTIPQMLETHRSRQLKIDVMERIQGSVPTTRANTRGKGFGKHR